MTDVLDSSTGQVIDHPDADIAKDWTAGKVQPVAGATYHFRFQNGSYGHASTPQEIAQAVQQGGQFVNADQAKAAVTAQHYEDVTGGALGAGAAGAISQGTLGLADVAGRYLGGEGYAKARQYQQSAHPIASMIGEGIGATGLAALTGGGSLAEEGVGAAAGAAAEGLQGVAARTLARGAAGALEGAQFGVSQSISQAAVQDPKLTAEQVIANVGGNALWGGLLGGGLGLAGEGLSAARGKLASRLAREPEADSLATVAQKALGVDEPADGLGDKIARGYAKLSGAVSGHDPADILNVLQNRGDLLNADEARNAASRAIRDNVDTVLSASRDIQEEAQRGLKRGYVRAAMDGVDHDTAYAAARGHVDETLSSLNEMLSSPEEYGGKAPIERAMTLAKRASAGLDAANLGGDTAEMFSTVDDLKKAIGKYTKGASRLSPGAATDELIALQNKARAGKLQDLYESLRTGLEDESTWGKAAQDQKAINAAWTQQIDASSRFHNALTTEVGRDPNNPWQNVRGVDPAKSDAYVRGLLDPSKDLTHKAVTDYVDATRKLADVMSEAYDLPAAKVAQVAKLRKAADAFGATLDDTSKKLTLVNQYEALRQQTDGHGIGMAQTLGYLGSHFGLGGGALGAAVGKGMDALARPAETIRKLAVLEQMGRESDGVIGRTLRSFGAGSARATKTAGLDTYARRVSQVERMAADPHGIAQRVQSATASLAPHAPQVHEALVATSLAATQFLVSKLPPQVTPDPLDPGAKSPLPPPSQRESFLRYTRAVDDPHSVLEDLRDGKLSLEGVEAMRTVYPSLYARTQQKTLEALSAGKLANLSAGQRYGLATLLDLPVPELSHEYIAARQAALAAPVGAFDPHPPGDGQEKPPAKSPKRSKPVPVVKPTLTTEKIESGEG